MSTYSNLSIELIGTGEQDGTWGTTTNVNLGTALEEAIVGTVDQAVGTGDTTPSWSTSSNATQVPRHLRINLTGSAGGTGNLIVPTLSGGKNYYIKNSSDTAITVKTSGGTGILVPTLKSMSLYQDGTNVVEAANYSVSYTIASGVIDNTTIGATTASTGAFTTLGATGDVTLGNAAGDSVTHNAQTVTIPNNLIYSGTGSVTQAIGTTGERPGSPANGMFRYNSTLSEFEGYAGGAWGLLSGGITASSTDTLTNKSIVATQLTGTVPTARLGSGTASSSVFLSGASTWIAAGGGATLVASDTSLGGTTVAFTSLDLSSYKILVISSSDWAHDGGSDANKIQILPNGGSNSLLGGDAVSSSSTPGNQYTTFDLNTGLYWTWTRNAMSAGVVAPIALPATGLQMGYNSGVSTATTSLTFSLDAGDDFNAGKMYIYGM